MKKYRRRVKVINPRLQWRFALSFTCVACAAVIFQGVIVNRMLIRIASELPRDADVLFGELTGVLGWGLALTLLLLVPVSVGLAIFATFRVAGPAYRMRHHLEQIARGEDPGICRIRKGDELHDLCDALNAAVETLRSGVREGDEEPAGEGAESNLSLAS